MDKVALHQRIKSSALQNKSCWLIIYIIDKSSYLIGYSFINHSHSVINAAFLSQIKKRSRKIFSISKNWFGVNTHNNYQLA